MVLPCYMFKNKYKQNISQRCEHNLFIIDIFHILGYNRLLVRNMLKPKYVTHIKKLLLRLDFSSAHTFTQQTSDGMLVNSIKGTIVIPVSYRNSYIDPFLSVYFSIQSVVCKCF